MGFGSSGQVDLHVSSAEKRLEMQQSRAGWAIETGEKYSEQAEVREIHAEPTAIISPPRKQIHCCNWIREREDLHILLEQDQSRSQRLDQLHRNKSKVFSLYFVSIWLDRDRGGLWWQIL